MACFTLYNKMSIKNRFVQCPIVFVCDQLWSDLRPDLWSDLRPGLWPVTCNLTCDLWPVTCTLAPPLMASRMQRSRAHQKKTPLNIEPHPHTFYFWHVYRLFRAFQHSRTLIRNYSQTTETRSSVPPKNLLLWAMFHSLGRGRSGYEIMPRLPPGGSLGTPKILSTGATLHLGPIRLHVENWECRALKSSARCQKFGVPCRFF